MRALITGASRGIGLELARVFAENGYDIVMVSRSDMEEDANRIRGLGVDVETFKCDLSSEIDAAHMVSAVGDVDVLVNNAGVMYFGDGAEYQRGMVFVNSVVPYMLCCAFLKRGAKVLNVASVSAFGKQYWRAVYGATKAFLLSLSLSLREEGYKVTCLCPGPTRTSLLGNRKIIFSMSPRDVALIGYAAFEKNQALVIPGTINKIAVLCSALFPVYQKWLKRKSEKLCR